MQELSKLDRVSIALFAMMQQIGMRCTYYKNPNDLFSHIFDINDMTNMGETFGVSININSKTMDTIEDNEQAIEFFCKNITLEIGHNLLNEKIARILQYQDAPQKSKIIIP